MTNVIRNWFHGAPIPDDRWQRRADPRVDIRQLVGGRLIVSAHSPHQMVTLNRAEEQVQLPRSRSN